MKHIKLFEQFINDMNRSLNEKKSVNEAVSVNTIRYKRSHGKEPRGTGKWAFYFDSTGDDPIFVPTAMSYSDAVKWAKEEAKKAGKSTVYVGESVEFLDEAMKEIDYSNSKNKIIAGLKTNLIYDMKDRYDYKEDGDKILFFDKKGHHFGTLFDAGTRYQMIQHDGSLDDKGRLSESLDEATTSWSKMMSSVRKSETGPWSLVAIKDKKVIAQKNDIRIKDMIPAHFEAMRKEYPKAAIHIEDGTGMVVWNESTNKRSLI